MCSHENVTLLDSHQKCCVDCGLLLGTFFELHKMQSHQDWSNDSLIIPYMRSRRFSDLLDTVCLGNETRNDKHMLYFLAKHKVSTRHDIWNTMKKSKLTDKRYSSVHLFCKCFDKDFLEFTSAQINKFLRLKKSMILCFNYIETKFYNIHNVKAPFFNYRFLASVLLQKFGLTVFTKYLKPLQCVKRIQKNIDSLNNLNIKFLDIDLKVLDTFQMNPKLPFL